MNTNIFPYACKHLPTVHYRVQKCYTLILAVGELASTDLNTASLKYMCLNVTLPMVCELMPDIVGMGDVAEHFKPNGHQQLFSCTHLVIQMLP